MTATNEPTDAAILPPEVIEALDWMHRTGHGYRKARDRYGIDERVLRLAKDHQRRSRLLIRDMPIRDKNKLPSPARPIAEHIADCLELCDLEQCQAVRAFLEERVFDLEEWTPG